MEAIVRKSTLGGRVRIPGSKSHTVRALTIGLLAEGTSTIVEPLESSDTRACFEACTALGARIEDETGPGGLRRWLVAGAGGAPKVPENVIDTRNSGTTLYVLLATAALIDGYTVFTGDEQIRARTAGPLLSALRDLGATAFSTRPGGCAPIVIGGPMTGGRTRIECPTSQYLTSLLINCPLARGDSDIEVPLLNERPYVEMTCRWLQEQAIEFTADPGFRRVRIPGRQHYHAFEKRIPADFSSATFFLVAAAVTGATVFLEGLDMTDSQGDKAVVDMLRRMGCRVDVEPDGLAVTGGELTGGEFDLNATPDALPAMAVAGCFARGETRLVNVPQARMKETDRIATMTSELRKMGADITERPDGLVVRESRLRGARVHGWKDHRVVMSLAVAGLACEGETTIETAEAVAVTFPAFADLMRHLGARIEMV